MNQINQITKIERMLEAMLMASNKLHWIGGYIYGRTSNGDPFVTLYPAADYLSNKICKVYPQDFRKLPSFIDPESFPKRPFSSQTAKRPFQIKKPPSIEGFIITAHFSRLCYTTAKKPQWGQSSDSVMFW